MKYISRITALLLALMMLTPTFASALTLDTATQSDLDIMYQAVAGYSYLEDSLGFKTAIHFEGADELAANGYTFQWYEILDDAPDREIVGATNYSYSTEFTLDAKQYYCIYADPNGIEYMSNIFVVAASTTDMELYLDTLFSLWNDGFGAYDSLKIYEYMTETWNVQLSNGENLAQNVIDYWYADWNEENIDSDLLCTCVVSGEVESKYTILHPNSDEHVSDCCWAKQAVVSSADVSKPELLLEWEPIVLTSPEAAADLYYWQEYRYNGDADAWEWETMSGGGQVQYTLTVNTDTIQSAYRVISSYYEGQYVIPMESKVFYLGGMDFFNWIKNTPGILEWMADESVTLVDVVARYNNAADEEDRTNATDYTAGSEGKEVNIQVNEGTFAEDYVLEVEESKEPANLLQTILTSLIPDVSMDAEILAAFDISFMGLNSGNELQPAEGHPVTLNFMLDTTNVSIENAIIYIYHMAKQADGTIIPEKVAGPEPVTYGAQMIPVTAASFSDYVAFATEDIHYYNDQILGAPLSLDAFEGRDMSGYNLQWYQYVNGINDKRLDDQIYQSCVVDATLKQVSYYCVATPKTGDGEPETSELFVVRANVTEYEAYLDELAGYYYDMEYIYQLMTEDWDVSVPYNLADAVMDYWYKNRNPEYYDYDLLCTCVVTGKVASSECLLHPDDEHASDCPWYVPSPTVEMRAEKDSAGNVTSYTLYVVDDEGEEQIIAVSEMLDGKYHYFKDITKDDENGWYVAYLHIDEETGEQWIIPLPSEKDLNN